MKHILTLLLGLTALTACGTRGGKTTDSPQARRDWQPEENKVEVITLQRTDFPVQILSNGRLSAMRKATLSFRTSGTISRLNVSPGSRVEKGAVIAQLDRPDLDLALESAQIALQRARLDLLDRLAGLGYTPKDTASIPADILEMARMRSGYTAARNALAKARYDRDGAVLKAPFTGRVADLSARVHDPAPSSALCTLLDDSAMEVQFTVMEADYARVSRGMAIRVRPFTDGSQEYRGQVTGINPSVGKNGLVTLTGSVPGASGLLDGMNVHVLLEKTLPGRLVVPKGAVVIRDNLPVLFTLTEEGTARWVYVNLLESNAESYAVEANGDRGATLAPGERVIVSGNLNLADGSAVVLK